MITAAIAVIGILAAAPPERRVLDNGVTVILQPVPGTGWVGMETIYAVGFVDEPAGLTQAAHLVEHLVCRGAIEGYEPGAAFERLNERGLANAETLATFTHYDAMVPKDQLDEALAIEAARLTSLRIDGPIIAQEAPRCYSEAAAVEGAPQAPMFKFALMAVNQSWRFGTGRALVKGGLAEAPVDAVAGFHRAWYTPANLTVVLVGEFDAEDAFVRIREHLGGLPGGARPVREPIEWAQTPKESTVRWDSTARGVVIAWPVPDDADERLALSIWATVAWQALGSDAEVQADAVFALGSMHIYPVGDLPLFVYATLKPDADVAAAGRIADRARELITRAPTATDMVQFRMLLEQLTNPQPLTAESVAQRAGQLVRIRNEDQGRAAGMVLGQAALQAGLTEMILGGDAERAARVKGMDAGTIAAIAARAADPSRRIITRLEPEGD